MLRLAALLHVSPGGTRCSLPLTVFSNAGALSPQRERPRKGMSGVQVG
jgi:hypothetical protein